MKIPAFPGTDFNKTIRSTSYNTSAFNGPLAENAAKNYDFRERTTSLYPAHRFNDNFISAVTERESVDQLRDIRNELLIELTQEVLPSWLRERWITMLMEMDFTTVITDRKVERLCRECSAARGNLGRLMPQETANAHKMADTELVLLTNGFNELANHWWLYKGQTAANQADVSGRAVA